MGMKTPVGKRMRAVAILLDLSATQVAEIMGWHRQRVYEMWACRLEPRHEELREYAKRLGCSLSWLIRGYGDPLKPGPSWPPLPDEPTKLEPDLTAVGQYVRGRNTG